MVGCALTAVIEEDISCWFLAENIKLKILSEYPICPLLIEFLWHVLIIHGEKIIMVKFLLLAA